MSKQKIENGTRVLLNSGLAGVIEHWDEAGNRFRLRYTQGSTTHTVEDHISTNDFEVLGDDQKVKVDVPKDEDLEPSFHDNQKPGLGDTSQPKEDSIVPGMSTEGAPNDHPPANSDGKQAPAKKVAAKKTAPAKDQVTTSENFG